MQLVAMGAQDVYLTGNPQITFFKVVYRRHTNFSKECIEQTFTGSIPSTAEGSVSCTLSRNGDLVQEIYLKATVVPNPTDRLIVTDDVTSWANTGDLVTIGTTAVDATWTALNNGSFIAIRFSKDITGGTGEIKANTVYYAKKASATTFTVHTTAEDATIIEASADATITAGTNVYIEQQQLDNDDMTDLIKTVEVEIGGQKIDKHYSQWLDIYNELFETSHDLRYAMANGSQTVPNVNTKTHYIPLRFWFNRNPGLALPLIALQYHEVKINMTLNPARSTGNGASMSEAKLLVNYLYLDTDERRRFAQVSHEYLIEQVQHTGVESSTPIDMNFNHPVKALFWTAAANPGKVKLQLNGHDRAAEQPHDYYHLVQPYESGLGHSGKSLDNVARTWGPVVNTANTQCVGMYSFCLKPAEHQPSGTCNFSRIDNARLNVDAATSLYLFALNYNVLRIMSGMGGLAYSN